MSVTFSKPFIYGQVIFWGGAGLIIAIFLAIQLFKNYERSVYQKHIESYLEKPSNMLSGKNSVPKDTIAITGKLVVINLNGKTIDPVFNSLPKELKPENPEQVKTVLWVQCSRAQSYAKYTDGSPAYANECNLTFIDLISKKYLWFDRVIVSPPISKRKGYGSDVADPGDEILRYIQNIPRKD